MGHRPLAVLHIAAPAAFGGLESVVRALALGQASRGDRVHIAAVVSPDHDTHPFVEAVRRDSVDVRAITVRPRSYLAERRAVERLCGELKPDVVHTHGFRPDVVDGGVASAFGATVVSTCHGFIDTNWRGRAYQWLQRRRLRHFDAVIAVAPSIAARLRGAGVMPEKIHVVHNAYTAPTRVMARDDARRMLGLPADGEIVGWVGRLSREKGADVALDALARLDRPDVRLAMVGAGPELASLQERARALGLGDRVVFTGAVPDVATLLAAFDAFLLSSRTEGTPMALLEAMAAGIPIVATRVGGIPDVLDAQSAILVGSEDSAAIADGLAMTFARPGAAAARVDAARLRVADEFGMERWLTRMEGVYRSAMRPLV